MQHQTSSHVTCSNIQGLHRSQIRSKCASVQIIMNSQKLGLLVIICFLVIGQSQCDLPCELDCPQGKNTYYTSHSAYVATATESDGVKIDGLLPPNFL